RLRRLPPPSRRLPQLRLPQRSAHLARLRPAHPRPRMTLCAPKARLILHIMRRLLPLLGVVLLPQSPYSPLQQPSGRESAGAALQRADRRLRVLHRDLWLREENYGANGRKNATRDAAADGEVPRAARSGFSGWSPW